MGCCCACMWGYCCLIPLKPQTIEILALIFSIITIAFSIWGMAGNPWRDIEIEGKILFYISFAFIIRSSDGGYTSRKV